VTCRPITGRRLVCSLLILITVAARADEAERGTGRDYVINSWQTDNGLPQNWVSSIAQTPDGYLWIGTRYGGLARFDGVRFVHFNQHNTPELEDVQVEYLTVDAAGRLWIVMGNESLTALDHGQFKLMRPPRSEPHLRLEQALCVRSNQVLFSSESSYLAEYDSSARSNQWKLLDPSPIRIKPGTLVLDAKQNVWFITERNWLAGFSNRKFQFAKTLHQRKVMALAANASRQVWIATASRLGIWDGQDFIDRTPTNGPAPEKIINLAFSGDGGLWVLEKNRLRKCLNDQWVAEADASTFQPDTDNGRLELYGDANGNAWLTDFGHGIWHIKSDGQTQLLTEKNGLPNEFITCWYQDTEGDVWVGMQGGGIARIRESLFSTYGHAQGLPGKVVSSLCVDENGAGTLWAGTMTGGLAYWENNRFVNVPLPATGDSPNESVTVFPGDDGSLWIGTHNHGLMKLSHGQISRPDAPWPTFRVLFGDSQHRLWIGGLVGLAYIQDGRVFGLEKTDGYQDSHAIGAMAEDRAGAIWIGTGPGELWKFAEDKFSRYAPPREWPSVRFSAVLPDTNGAVWIGTLGGGLLRFDHGRFTRCQQENGLPDNNISQLLDSHDGYLWCGTYTGVFRARKADLEAVLESRERRVSCQVYGRFDGLPALECSSGFQPACWRSKDGRLWFSTANGVASVDPSKTVPNPIPPAVIIEEMLVDGKPLEYRTGEQASGPPAARIKISPGRHYVQFRFTGLSFAAPDGVRFRAKLDGGDGEWHSVGGQRLMGYGPLLPGDYQFQVIACNNDGVWNDRGAAIAFTVMPYFWQTWIFKVILAGGTLTALAIIVATAQRRRYRRKLERVERQREMERERTRIARDLHDDLGTSLTQISMLSALANREKTPADEAKELIQQVRSRARAMVIALDEIVWAVNPKNDSVAGLVGYLGHFAEEFYKHTEIRFRQEIPAALPNSPLSAESRHHLFLAFKEAVNNVARHAGATQVQVRMEIANREIVVHIEDNGRGFEKRPAAAPCHEDGLGNMRHRMEQIGGSVTVSSQPGTGTTVTFRVPFEK
jgi:signal transduction histidine kinase/ligand-binding sensor domain-containing protein